jgi:hypothetical protein
LAIAIGRSAVTVRRWERAGIIPPAQRQTRRPGDQEWRRTLRWYDQDTVKLYARLAEKCGLVNHQQRTDQFVALLRAERERRLHDQAKPIEVQPWAEVAQPEPEPAVHPWNEMSNERRRPRPLPERCPHCTRRPVVTGVQRPTGERVLVSACDRHGQIGVIPWT